MKWAVLLALLLGGCSNPFEDNADARQSQHHSQCQSYGLKYGTPEYGNCLMNLDQQDTSNRQALIGAYLANQRPQPAPQPYVLPIPAQPPPPRSCASQVAGQMIYTNCN